MRWLVTTKMASLRANHAWQCCWLLQWVYISGGQGTSAWICTKHFTLSHTTSFSLYWRHMDLMAVPLVDKKLAGGSSSKCCNQDFNIQVQSNDEQGQYWKQHFLTTLLVIQTMGLSTPSASLLMTPSCCMRLSHWREGMLSRGTWQAWEVSVWTSSSSTRLSTGSCT